MSDEVQGLIVVLGVIILIVLIGFSCAVLLNNSNNNAKIEQLQICSKIESSNFNACLQGINR